MWQAVGTIPSTLRLFRNSGIAVMKSMTSGIRKGAMTVVCGKSCTLKKETVYGEEMVDLLDTPFARARFQEHLEAMRESDVCILLLPCGRSAHIEAGYMKGLGKTVYVLGSVFDELKPELMYLTFDAFFPFYEPLFDLLDDDDDN